MVDESDASNRDGSARPMKHDFDEPDDILDNDDLSYDEKLDILQRLKADLEETSNRSNVERLQRVEQAIERLQADVALDPDKPDAAPSAKGYRPQS